MSEEKSRTPRGVACLDDREPFTALAAAVGENFTAADGGLAGTKTDLTGALFAVRAEGGLHTFKWLRGDRSAGPPRGCQGTV